MHQTFRHRIPNKLLLSLLLGTTAVLAACAGGDSSAPGNAEAPAEDVSLEGYITWARPVVTRAGENLNELRRLGYEASAKPEVYNSREFGEQTLAAISEMRAAAREIRLRQAVPPEAEEVHQRMLEMAVAIEDTGLVWHEMVNSYFYEYEPTVVASSGRAASSYPEILTALNELEGKTGDLGVPTALPLPTQRVITIETIEAP